MQDLKIKFDGQTHQIEANTLINSLLHFTTIVQEINKDLKSDRKIEVKINALPEGSFLVDLTIEAAGWIDKAKELFSGPGITSVANIVTVVGGVFGLSKFLAGKAIKEMKSAGDKTTITNIAGDVIIIENLIVNIYVNNKKIPQAISQEFAMLDNDPNVTGYEMLDSNNEPIVRIDKPEFAAIGSSSDFIEDATDNVIVKKVMLNIVRLSFDTNQKWEFYYEGNKISAKINEDDAFLKKIDNGEPFAKGDSLEAELEIRQEFDKTVDTFINKSYKINRIINHIPRPQQSKLDLPG